MAKDDLIIARGHIVSDMETPEMLYRQVQYLVREDDWAGSGSDVDFTI